ncbi:rod shape-determining protein MreD [Lacticaseibacillus parakribbianus]|uniref:rod shape-determining protein MreD n=1 Tax=Lacticaseibacillus parakribbianus TaxID=2970927 RepID=UPI0021CAEC70|nr:rod shape-determining protein MreD [Lacticaseibacillus parakribbianus]
MLTDPVFKGHGWVALVLAVALLLDGTLAQVLAQWLMVPAFTGVPQLTLMALVMIALVLPDEAYIVAIAAVVGLIADSFYTGMLGVNLLLWPLLVYVVRQIEPLIPKTALYVGAVVILTLITYIVANYFVARFLGATSVGLIPLIARHVGPGLTVNLILFALVYAPLARLLKSLRIAEQD